MRKGEDKRYISQSSWNGHECLILNDEFMLQKATLQLPKTKQNKATSTKPT